MEHTPEDICKAVERHQKKKNVHPLTCGKDSSHLLRATIEDGKAVLVCTQCDYKQIHIPESVLDFDDKIYDLIYCEEAKQDIIKLFPTAKIEDASDYIHEGRFSVTIEGMRKVDYLEKIAVEGLSNVSLMFGVLVRTDEELFAELKVRLEARNKERMEELKRRWDEIDGTNFFGMTFEEFGKMQRDAIEKFAKENKDFAKFLGWEQ